MTPFTIHTSVFKHTPCPVYILDRSSPVSIDISSSMFISCEASDLPGDIFCSISTGSVLLTRISFFECSCPGNAIQVFEIDISNYSVCAASLLSITKCGSENSKSLGCKICAEIILENTNFSNIIALYEPAIQMSNNREFPIAVLYVNIEECTAIADTVFSMYGSSNTVRSLSSFHNNIGSVTYIRFIANSSIENSNFGNLNIMGNLLESGTLKNCLIEDNIKISNQFTIISRISYPTNILFVKFNALIPSIKSRPQMRNTLLINIILVNIGIFYLVNNLNCSFKFLNDLETYTLCLKFYILWQILKLLA